METISCDVCGEASNTTVFSQYDLTHHVTDDIFTVVRCQGCRLLFVNPRPTRAEIGRYYPDSYYPEAPPRPAGALRRMVKEAKTALSEGRSILIFPEGTRGLPGQPGEYKPGIAALYRELNMPVTPLALNCGGHWNKGFVIKPGAIVFDYLEPIPAGLKRGEFMRELQTRIDTATKALEDSGV